MGPQLAKILLAALALAAVTVACNSGHDPALDKAEVAPLTGKPNEGPPEGSKPKESANKPATAGAKAAELPPGANRDHP